MPEKRFRCFTPLFSFCAPHRPLHPSSPHRCPTRFLATQLETAQLKRKIAQKAHREGTNALRTAERAEAAAARQVVKAAKAKAAEESRARRREQRFGGAPGRDQFGNKITAASGGSGSGSSQPARTSPSGTARKSPTGSAGGSIYRGGGLYGKGFGGDMPCEVVWRDGVKLVLNGSGSICGGDGGGGGGGGGGGSSRGGSATESATDSGSEGDGDGSPGSGESGDGGDDDDDGGGGNGEGAVSVAELAARFRAMG